MKKRIGKLNNKVLVEGGDLETLKSNEIKVEKDGNLITRLITRNNNNIETVIGTEYRGIREDLSEEEFLKILEKAGYYILDGNPVIPIPPFTVDDKTLEVLKKYMEDVDMEFLSTEYIPGAFTGEGMEIVTKPLKYCFDSIIGFMIQMISPENDVFHPYGIPFKIIRPIYNISSNDDRELSIDNGLNSDSIISYYTLPIQAPSIINKDGNETIYFVQNLQEIVNILESAYDECVKTLLENYPFDSMFSDSETFPNPNEIPQEDKNVLIRFFKHNLEYMYKFIYKESYFGDARLFKPEIMDMLWPKIPASKALNGQWVYDYQTRIEELKHYFNILWLRKEEEENLIL